MELAGTSLDSVPALARSRWHVLRADEVVAISLDLAERVLHMRALREASAEESSVDNQQDPRSGLEEDSGQEQADPQEDLESRHDRHGHVVVGLDE